MQPLALMLMQRKARLRNPQQQLAMQQLALQLVRLLPLQLVRLLPLHSWG